MTLADVRKTAEGKMDQSIAAFKNNLTKVRTGRANPATRRWSCADSPANTGTRETQESPIARV